jgi:hypothetical protein
MRKMVRSLMLGAMIGATGMALPSAAAPITMGFTPITFPDTVSTEDQADLTEVAGQFSVTIDYIVAPAFVTAIDPAYTNMVSFTFSNTGDIGSNITEIYWDWTPLDPALLDPTIPAPGGFYEDPTGETWVLEAPPAPGPGGVDPWVFPLFVAEAAGDGAGGGQVAGLRNNEPSTTFYMGLGTDPNPPNALATWDMIISSLKAGDIRFGLHVRSIETYLNSDGGPTSYHFISVPYVEDNTPEPVPVPAAAGLGFLGMALIGVMRRKKS